MKVKDFFALYIFKNSQVVFLASLPYVPVLTDVALNKKLSKFADSELQLNRIYHSRCI